MAQSPAAQVALRMTKLTREVRGASDTAVTRAAFDAKKIIEREIRSVAPSGRLRNVGSSGAKIGVRYNVKGATNPTALVRAYGPIHLIENPIQPHTIIPRGVGRARGRTRAARRQAKQDLYNALFGSQYAGVKPLRTPYGPRYRVRHPGVRRSSGPWKRGRMKAAPIIRRTVERSVQDAFRRGVM